jgi:hypothetical protein
MAPRTCCLCPHPTVRVVGTGCKAARLVKLTSQTIENPRQASQLERRIPASPCHPDDRPACLAGKPGNGDADDGAVHRDQGEQSGFAAVLPDGGFLRAVLRGRGGRVAGARHHADQARPASGPGYPDVRRAGACGRRLSAEADRERGSASPSASRPRIRRKPRSAARNRWCGAT